MAVTEAKEIHNGRQGGEETTSQSAVRRHVRRFRVRTNSATDDEVTVLASTVALGTAHPNDPDAFLKRRFANQEDFSKLVWIVTLEYDTQREQTSTPLTGPDPVAEPALISWSTEQFQRPVWEDKDGDAIVNSAGDPFEKAPLIDDSREVITIRKNLSDVPSWILTYKDAINDAAVTIDGISIAARKAKVQRIEVSPEQDHDGIKYRVLTLVLHIRDETWDLKVLDQGYREIASSTERKNIVNDNDSADPGAPVLLNGSGAVLSDPKANTAVFLTFDVYNQKDFSVLPLS